MFSQDLQSDDNGLIDLPTEEIYEYTSRSKGGTWFEIVVTKHGSTKSDPLRKRYFSSVLPPWMREIGYDPDEKQLVHDQLKIRYFNIEPDKRGICRNVPSVFSNESEMDVFEKHDFVEWVIRKAAIDGVVIKKPRRPPK